MGMVVCPKHGNGFMFVCPHVADAVQCDRACGGIRQLSHWIDDLPEVVIGCWYCPQCVSEHQIPPSGSVTEGEAFRMPSSIHMPMCPGCFEEWHVRQRTPPS